MKHSIDIFCKSTAEHLTQIFTGFSLLRDRNLIDLKFVKEKNFTPGTLGTTVLRVILNKKYKLVYDMFDGKSLYPEDLSWCDLYFKRSYSQDEIDKSGLGKKILPFGFNYSVYSESDNQTLLKLFWSLQRGFKIKYLYSFVRSNLILSYLFQSSNGKFTSRVSQFEIFPEYSKKPRILFMTRLWNPKERKDQIDREEMNKMRGECIRLLRKEFGDQFIGGLEPSEEAELYFKDIVFRKNENRKLNYMKILKSSDICVSTRGLLGSNGWKFAEYVAGAKAIVSEPLMFEVPGSFLPNRNYLEFNSPEECVSRVKALIDNPDLRYSLMKNNFDYYHSYLRPDILIWNTIVLALSKIKD